MNPEEASKQVEIIREMIARSRAQRARSGDVYVVWGVLIAVALAVLAASVAAGYRWGWLVWLVVVPIGATYAAIAGARRAAAIETWASRVEARTWIMTGAALGVIAFLGPATGRIPNDLVTPAVAALVAVPLGTSGEVYRARPLALASWLFLAVSAVTLFLPWSAQLGVFSGALLLGYVLPGLLLMREASRDA